MPPIEVNSGSVVTRGRVAFKPASVSCAPLIVVCPLTWSRLEWAFAWTTYIAVGPHTRLPPIVSAGLADEGDVVNIPLTVTDPAMVPVPLSVAPGSTSAEPARPVTFNRPA